MQTILVDTLWGDEVPKMNANFDQLKKRHLSGRVVEKTTALADGSDVVGSLEIPVAGTIKSIRAKTDSGTATVVFKKGAATVGTVNATTAGVNVAANTAVAAYDSVTLDISSASGSGLSIDILVEEA